MKIWFVVDCILVSGKCRLENKRILVNVICPGLFSSHMSTASFKSVDDPQNCQEWGVHSSVFSVFFLMSKFRVPTIFLARNSGFYGFLKNETLLREGIFSGHQYVRCEQCSTSYVKYYWLLAKLMATVHWNLAMANWWNPNLWLRCEHNNKELQPIRQSWQKLNKIWLRFAIYKNDGSQW
jgi:hypothetical protein